ncbi:MAG: hypothetical protein HOJ13_00975 [Nitrospina sp.]|nr:hypothetical protein [Nitrospina sp.]
MGTENITISVPDKLTTTGDLLYNNGSVETSLAIGNPGQILTNIAGVPAWSNPSEGDKLFNSNVLLNAYRTAENGNGGAGLPILNMINGIADAFEFVTGVDAAVSSNAVYDPTNDLYKPTDDGSGFTTPMITFDGTNDYLSVASSTLGHSDGKSFLFSVWFNTTNTSSQRFVSASTQERFAIMHESNRIRVFLVNPSGTVIADLTSLPKNTWIFQHLLIWPNFMIMAIRLT